MIEIESRVTDSLHARADRGIKIDGLHGGAVARAGRIRRRRRAAAMVAATGLAAVLTAGIAVAPRLLPVGGTGNHIGGTGNAARPPAEDPAGPPHAPPGTKSPTTLPAAQGAPSAAEQPAVVGTDPAVLHFDVNGAAVNAIQLDWTATAGYESVAIQTAAAKRPIEIFVSPDAKRIASKPMPPGPFVVMRDGKRVPDYTPAPGEPVTIDGRPGTLQRVNEADLRRSLNTDLRAVMAENWPDTSNYAWMLRWEPVDGLHAVVSVHDQDKSVALEVARAMRFDQAQRCAVPVTVTRVPTGATLSYCQTAMRRTPIKDRGIWEHSYLKLRKPGGGEATVWLEDAKRPRHKHDTSQFKPHLTVAGHPAQWLADQPKGLWILNFGAAEVFVTGSGQDEAVWIAGGLRMVADLFHPQTWPQRPIG